jgi:23S rRNA (guanine2445-N2)-methyltransferase / 23S rRNA (guanine2069-N7)-methyltransferase
MKKSQQNVFAATCPGGLEPLVEQEIKGFGGGNITAERGVVRWLGGLETAYRCCLWSRCSSRVLLQLGKFTAATDEALYRGVKEVAWQQHLGVGDSFAVNCTISEAVEGLTHSQYAALKAKDAVADHFRERLDKRPAVEVQRPKVQIHLHLGGGEATLFIDLSGEPLHRRGYRRDGGTAPLKETLAAAIITLSGWDGNALIDPMCGSGTLLIEAAMIHGDSAPGLSRSYFGFSGWRGHDQILWEELVSEALQCETQAENIPWPRLEGYDSDPVAVAAARRNISSAGLAHRISVKQAELATLSAPEPQGTLLANLPYGERVAEKDSLVALYKAYGRIAQERFAGWRVAALIADAELTDSFGLSWQQRYRLYNGPLRCRLLVSENQGRSAEAFLWDLPPSPETGAFGNRLSKNLRRIRKWANREQVSCYRIYDRDLPEYNFSIDIYEKWVHVQEYQAPDSIDGELAAARLQEALAELRAVLGIRRERVFLKKRRRQRGSRQYTKTDQKSKVHEVGEGPARFLVNLSGYLDTGLFLDHRPLRLRIGREAAGRRFLNLFGYTGTASVHAALGGATRTVTVDLSATYLRWARANLALNGLDIRKNQLVQSDCMQWLTENEEIFDLIFVDPPTFSNTAKKRRVFDIQRDHLQLLLAVMKRLAPGGVALFSTNYKRFRLAESLVSRYDIQEITSKTVPFDFAGKKRVHRCWEIKHREGGGQSGSARR